MNIHLCGAYVTQIRKLDKHGNPTGPNLCREPMQITEDNCTNPDHGHPVKETEAEEIPVWDSRHPDYSTPAALQEPKLCTFCNLPPGHDGPHSVPNASEEQILKEDTFEVNLGPVAPITHTDSAGADATKYPGWPNVKRHSWAPDEARSRINERRFNEPIPCDEDEGP